MRVYPEQTVDEEFKSLGDAGYTGSLNDRQYSFLVDQGLFGSLPDLMYAWRTLPAPPTLLLEGSTSKLLLEGVTDAIILEGSI